MYFITIINIIFILIYLKLLNKIKLKLSLTLTLYVLNEIFKVLSDKSLLETVLMQIFGILMNKNTLNLIIQPIKQPISYSFQWFVDNFWDEYLQKEKLKYDEENKNEDDDSDEDDDNTKIKSDPFALFILKAKDSKAIQLNDLKSFYKNDHLKFEQEHKRLSKVLGIITKAGLDNSEELLDKNPLFFSNLLKSSLIISESRLNIEKITSNNDFVNNPLREIFFSFFKVLFYL